MILLTIKQFSIELHLFLKMTERIFHTQSNWPILIIIVQPSQRSSYWGKLPDKVFDLSMNEVDGLFLPQLCGIINTSTSQMLGCYERRDIILKLLVLKGECREKRRALNKKRVATPILCLAFCRAQNRSWARFHAPKDQISSFSE